MPVDCTLVKLVIKLYLEVYISLATSGSISLVNQHGIIVCTETSLSFL